MCLSQCINHFCPNPKPSHHRPCGLVRFARPPPSNFPAPSLSLSLPLPVSSISHRDPHYLFVSLSHYFRTKACAYTCLRADARGRAHRGRGPHVRPYGRGDESNRHRSARISPTDPPSLLILPPHPPRGSAGLRAFLMLNVAFCLCGCMGDSGERRSSGQRFFQMLNARFVPTHTVCPCYVVSTGLPGTSQRTRQLRGPVSPVWMVGEMENASTL